MISHGCPQVHFTKELQWFRGGHGFVRSRGSSFQRGFTIVPWWTWIHWFILSQIHTSMTYEKEPNRPRVLWEQKVLPEARNGPLLLRDFFSFWTFEKLLRIQWGILPFYPFNLQYIYKTKLKFENTSQVEVGVLWVARRYRFRILRFKLRGM